MLSKKICFVDVETTGASINFDRIIEIGILRVEDNKLTKTFQSLVDPQHYLPDQITGLTGISPKDLENAPTFRQIKDELAEILEDCVFVAHNVRFDLSFVKNEFKRVGINFAPKHFCTVKLSRKLFPQFQHHALDYIIERYNFKIKNRHRAFDDAEILWKFYQKIQTQFSEEILLSAIKQGLKRPSIPIRISQEQLDNLPDTPGVYIFYGENGTPLYIGKSVNIRGRVLSHFSADQVSSIEMKIAQQVESIEVIQTCGELGALLKEATLIKKMQPLYNRKLRNAQKMLILTAQKNTQGYLEVKFLDVDQIEIEKLDQVLAVMKSKKRAKDFLRYICKQFDLCEKLLGVETTNSECFAARLGRCQGACSGKEDVKKYNLRFETAFAESRIKPWPFKDAILIEEKEKMGELSEAFVIKNWCYLGDIKSDMEVINPTLEKEIRFDFDTYKIIDSYLRNDKMKRKIKQVSLNQILSLNA